MPGKHCRPVTWIDQEIIVQIVPVIFEDHNLVRMRPLAWSTPVFELRCGMFNNRERVGMCGDGNGGVLLGRGLFSELHTAAAWKVGANSLTLPVWNDSRFLFLNGMLSPDFSLIRGLMDMAAGSEGFVWQNDEGLCRKKDGTAKYQRCLEDTGQTGHGGAVRVRLARQYQGVEELHRTN